MVILLVKVKLKLVQPDRSTATQSEAALQIAQLGSFFPRCLGKTPDWAADSHVHVTGEDGKTIV
ncbi:hypothetical protein ABTM13_20205, partial [Acinetobacter baumannii]